MLIVVLSMSACLPALAESGISAADVLFGGAVGADAGTVPAGDASGSADDVYGANDQTSVNAYKTLQLGDRDDADGAAYIVMMQNRLIALGFLKGTADGVYGQATETAVAQFQKLNGMEQTGIADPAMQQKLFSDVSTLTTPSPDNNVVYGSEAIRVQTRLAEWGFLTGSVDGVMGSGTEKAISTFKKYLMEVSPELLATPTPEPTAVPTPVPTPAPGAMQDIVDMPKVTPTPSPSPQEIAVNGQVTPLVLEFVDSERPFEVYRQTVQNGDSNAEVARVQTRLKQLGYLYPDPDGAFGSSTAFALRAFQTKNGLSDTGVADEATQRRLFSASALKTEEYVFPYKLVVDISEQRVYAYPWNGTTYSSSAEKKFVCSTGKDATPTPLGTYQSYGRRSGEWFYFEKYNCYAKWAYGIVGGILFHSVTYSASKKLNQGSVNNLGRKASHGCVRLKVDDAKWIWENCPLGTTVVIQK